jgi:hypothetical protein
MPRKPEGSTAHSDRMSMAWRKGVAANQWSFFTCGEGILWRKSLEKPRLEDRI